VGLYINGEIQNSGFWSSIYKDMSMLAVICTWLVLIDEGLWLILSIL
jgi:hypothetical protein